MKKRVQKIFKNIGENVDAVVIKNSSEKLIDSNFFYVTGLKKGLFEGSAVILFPGGNIDLIVPPLEAESASRAKELSVNIYKNKDDFIAILNDSLKNVKHIGLNFSMISHKEFSEFKDFFSNSRFSDVGLSFDHARMIKDDEEIQFLKKASDVVDRVVKKIPETICDGLFEYELAAEMDYMMERFGADKPAFETISSFGANTAEPHYSHGPKKIQNGDFVLCDFGASHMKYNSDTTRTFVFGDSTEKQKHMYETVKKAQEIGLQKIKPGVKASEIHNAVFAFIEKSQFKGCFIHSTGHSLGLDVHDPGFSISSECETILKENMVFTVEPGVYIPGFGGVRIEDDIVVTEDGFEFLTKSKKELIEI